MEDLLLLLLLLFYYFILFICLFVCDYNANCVDPSWVLLRVTQLCLCAVYCLVLLVNKPNEKEEKKKK